MSESTKPSNGASPDDPRETPIGDAIHELRTDVTTLRVEVRQGFADLKTKDAEHDDALKKLATRVAIPTGVIVILVEVLKVVAAYLAR